MRLSESRRRHGDDQAVPVPPPLVSSDPPPGNMVMWRGLSRMTDVELGAAIGAKIVGN
jgi:hypothetical protein